MDLVCSIFGEAGQNGLLPRYSIFDLLRYREKGPGSAEAGEHSGVLTGSERVDLPTAVLQCSPKTCSLQSPANATLGKLSRTRANLVNRRGTYFMYSVLLRTR